MTRPEADAMLREWGALHGLPGVFNRAGLAAVSVGTTSVVFEWSAEKQAIIGRATVYRFRSKAAPAVRAKLEGAGLEVLSDSGAVCVAKSWTKPLAAPLLDTQLEALVASSLQWTTAGLERLFA